MWRPRGQHNSVQGSYDRTENDILPRPRFALAPLFQFFQDPIELNPYRLGHKILLVYLKSCFN